MTKIYLTTLTGYNTWASRRIIEKINSLPPEIADTILNSSYETIRKTIYHIWDGQIVWLKRLQGLSLREWPSSGYAADFPGYDQYFLHNCEQFNMYVQSMSEGHFTSVIRYDTMAGKPFQNTVWEIIMHCMNHSTYHRGQIITMLRNLQVTDLPQTDLILYLREQK